MDSGGRIDCVIQMRPRDAVLQAEGRGGLPDRSFRTERERRGARKRLQKSQRCAPCRPRSSTGSTGAQ